MTAGTQADPGVARVAAEDSQPIRARATRRLGAARFEQAVRREITRRGRQKPCLRIVRGLFTALADPAGVIAHRPGALERPLRHKLTAGASPPRH